MSSYIQHGVAHHNECVELVLKNLRLTQLDSTDSAVNCVAHSVRNVGTAIVMQYSDAFECHV